MSDYNKPSSYEFKGGENEYKSNDENEGGEDEYDQENEGGEDMNKEVEVEEEEEEEEKKEKNNTVRKGVQGKNDTFFCPFCSKNSGSRNKLRKHLGIDHPDKFYCDRCFKVVNQYFELQKHMEKKKHW